MSRYTMYDIFMGTNGFPGPGIMATVPTLMEMTEGGIMVDPVECSNWLASLRAEMFEAQKQWSERFAPINPLSNQQLGKLLYGEWELPVQRSKEDGVTVDELACINLRNMVISGGNARKTRAWMNDPRCTPDVFDMLLNIRRISKETKTYAEVLIHGDGKVHPGYLPESKDTETLDGTNKKRKGLAATGRLASRDPNIQNQSKRARKMYITDNIDLVFVEHDWRAAELYVTAAVSGDSILMDDLASGDIHTRNAARLGCERRTAKAVIYGTNYGAGKQKISDTILVQDGVYISPDECGRVQDGIAKTYHVMWAYRQLIASMCVDEGCVVNPMGRIRYYYNGASDITSAYDYVPQSTVADVAWCVLRDVARLARSLGGRLTTTVHDSLLAQIPVANVNEYAIGVKAIMERTFDCVAPGFFIPADVKVGIPGGSWANMSKWEAA